MINLLDLEILGLYNDCAFGLDPCSDLAESNSDLLALDSARISPLWPLAGLRQ